MKTALLHHGQKRIVSIVILAALGTSMSMVAMHDSSAAPVDDSRVMQLEQELRALRSQLEQQARRIDALEIAVRQARGGKTVPPVALPETKDNSSAAWLQSKSWDKLRPGMSESDVVSVLGPPTTSRSAERGPQILFYALELEAGGFLSGRVVIADHRVLEIHRPELK